MAANTENVATILIPLKMPVNNKMYKILIKQQEIPFISANQGILQDYLKQVLPDEPDQDPIYIDMTKVRSSNSSSETTSNSCPISPDQDTNEGQTQSKTRFDWTFDTTNQLLRCIKDNEQRFEKATNKNSVWNFIASALKGLSVTGLQCRERYYTLKKAYRKFNAESNKTGNKRPRPFLYEDLMADILQNDPTFSPVVAKGTLKHDQDNTSEDDDEEPGTSSKSQQQSHKKKKTQFDHLKEYMEEMDQHFWMP